MQPLRRAFEAVYHGDTRARLAEQVAMNLRAQLPADHIVLPRYAARDGGERVSLVVVGRERIFVIEPLVLLVRGRPDDVRSSSVTVVAGVDALARHLLQGEPALAAPERTLALAMALQHRITLTTT